MIYKISFYLLFLPTVIFSQPDWVSNRPSLPGYYLGVGAASKSKFPSDFQSVAKMNAIADLSSEISVIVKSETVLETKERNNLVTDELSKNTSSIVSQVVEGFEVVDSWSDEEIFWIMVRMSKADFDLMMNQKFSELEKMCSETAIRSDKLLSENKWADALSLKIRTLIRLDKSKPVFINGSFADKTQKLEDEIISTIEYLIRHLEITSSSPDIFIKSGAGEFKEITIFTKLSSDKGKSLLAQIPLQARFIRGDGEITASSVSNEKGEAIFRISRIYSSLPDQQIQISANIDEIMNGVPGHLVDRLIGILNSSKLNIHLSVEPSRILVKPEILSHDFPVDISPLVNIVKDSLSKYNLTITDSSSISDFIVSLRAQFRKGGEAYGQFSSFVDFSISVGSLKNSTGLLELALGDTKGMGLDYNGAAQKALQKLKSKLDSSLFKRIVERITGKV